MREDALRTMTPPLSTRLLFRWQKIAVWLASKLVKRSDGIVVSRSVYMAGVAGIAELDGFVDRSGLLKHRTHAAAKISEKSRAAHMAFVNAIGIMAPTTTLPEMRDRYVGQRIKSLSRNQQRKPQYAAAIARFNQLLGGGV